MQQLKSENIGRVAHNLEWERFPRDFNLAIIVARSRIPCSITAGKFVTMSFSYYTRVSIFYCVLIFEKYFDLYQYQ